MTNPTYGNAPGPIYDEIDLKPDPSYKKSESKVGPTYEMMPFQYEEAKPKEDESHHEYDDIVSDVCIKMTRNPSYSAT